MTYFPELPYLFAVMTMAGTVKVDFPATQWDVAAAPTVDGPGADMLKGYIADWGIGFHGQLFTLEAVSPMDLAHALLMNQTTRHDLRIASYEVIGFVPEENPDAEDNERWADDDSEEGADDA